ncbi:hypothetical protein Tco_1240546, partial [Tanacetum coccineum]
IDIDDHSFSSNSKIELFLFNSNNCISSVKKWSSQDEGNFTVFFHFKNNKISRKGLRVLRDSLAYNEYGIRLMLAPRSAKALQEKVLLKLHGIRKLLESPSLGGTLFWIIAEVSSLKKAAEICSILCLFIFFIIAIEVDRGFRIILLVIWVNWCVIGFTTSYEYGIYVKIAVVDRLWSCALLGLVECYLEEIQKVDQIACQ